MIKTKNKLVKLNISLGAIALVFALSGASAASAALTLGAFTVASDGALTLTVAADSAVTVGTGRLVLSPTFSGASSRQSVEADGTLSGFTGGYGAAVMGNIMGTVGAGNSIVAGLIGKYNVGTNPSDHPAAGVVGEVGEDSAGTADAAVMAVLGGDSGELDAGAAYGVRYLNSTAGSQFNYGLDLFSGAIDSYNIVSYATADIRLQNGETISNGTDGTVAIGGTLVTGNFISPAAGIDLTDGADAGSTCAAGNKGAIQIDTGNSFFGCDGTNWQQLDN